MSYFSDQRLLPFHDAEALYAAVATTRRAAMVPLDDADFRSDGLPCEGYADPWTVVSIRHADVDYRAGRLVRPVTETAEYLGAR